MDQARPLARARWLGAPPTRHVLDALEADGAAVRFVGGCVRDTLVDPTLDAIDLDIATPAPPERNVALLEAAGIRTVPTGIAHGTITAIAGDRSYEITTLRRDVATDGRRAVVAYTDCFVEDAARRDFTINAMSCDRTGYLFDPFTGLLDLEAGRIRFVGSPTLRIREDYLRILRFFRFYARFGRIDPDVATLTALAAERAGLDRLSGERLQAELGKLLMGPMVEASLALMRQTGVWRQLFGVEPALARFGRLIRLAPEAGPVLRLAALLRDRADPLAVATRLRLSNAERDRLVALATWDLPPAGSAPEVIRRLVYQVGSESARDALSLAAAEAGVEAAVLAPVLATVADFAPPVMPVAGRDLLERGFIPGPTLGAALRVLEKAWIESDFKADRQTLLALLETSGDET